MWAWLQAPYGLGAARSQLARLGYGWKGLNLLEINGQSSFLNFWIHLNSELRSACAYELVSTRSIQRLEWICRLNPEVQKFDQINGSSCFSNFWAIRTQNRNLPSPAYKDKIYFMNRVNLSIDYQRSRLSPDQRFKLFPRFWGHLMSELQSVCAC